MNGPLHQYRGLFGRNARRRCPHSQLMGVYGDEITYVGWWRIWCRGCGRYLDGPVSLVASRFSEIRDETAGQDPTGRKDWA